MTGTRILTVVHDLGIGGTQRAAQNLAVAYRRLGYDSAVLAFGEGGPRAAPLLEAGVSLFLPDDARLDAVGAALAWRPDLLHVHRAGWADDASGAVLERLTTGRRPPVVETNVFGRPDYSPVEGVIDLHAHISMWSAWRWSQLARWRRRRAPACLLPYACDTSAFDRDRIAGERPRDRLGLPADAFVVGRVGQPSEPKWSAHTVDAFERLALESPDAWLLLVGAPASVRSQVQALPAAVRRRVRLLEPTATELDLVRVYAALDVFLHSSRIGESFGMVLAESMSCRTPVVTLSTPHQDNAQCEVVGDGVGGIVATTTEQLVAALRELQGDAPARDRLGASGRARIERLFSVPAIEARAATVVETMLAAEPSTAAASVQAALGDHLEQEIVAHLPGAGSDPMTRLVRSVAGHAPLRARAHAYAANHPGRYVLREPRTVLAGLRGTTG